MNDLSVFLLINHVCNIDVVDVIEDNLCQSLRHYNYAIIRVPWQLTRTCWMETHARILTLVPTITGKILKQKMFLVHNTPEEFKITGHSGFV